MHLYGSWIIAGLLVFCLKMVDYLLKARLMKKMPPGPPGLPLTGHIFQLSQSPWIRFTQWKAKYGPIFTLNFAGQPVVVINDFATAADLLDRRSNIYSDRSRFIMASEILSGNMNLALISYGDRWRRMRRAAHEGFNHHATAAYHSLIEKQSSALAWHLLSDPLLWDMHLRRSAASTALGIIYGWPPLDASTDTVVNRINTIAHRLAYASMPGSYLVDLFPPMLHLPAWIAKWKRDGRKFFKKDTEMFENLLHDAENMARANNSEPCFSSTLIEGKGLDRREAAWLAGTMFIGGSETTAAVLSVFILAMTLYPDVMSRAQTQIDAIVGHGRMPTFSDLHDLPYIRAIVKETLRWRPVGPVSVPRQSTKDDWYKGYFIPKDTIIIVNIWAINRDPAYFVDYDEFRPERYIDEFGNLTDVIPDTHSQGHLSYGSGRRICPGKEVANDALFINIATILWAFNIEKAVDEAGQPIVPSRTEIVDEGLVIRPAPFECAFTPRSPEIVKLINSYATSNVGEI